MNFIILMGLCIATAVGYGVVEHQTGRSFNYFEEGSQPSENYVVNALVIFACVSLLLSPHRVSSDCLTRFLPFLACSSGLIVFQNIVPISLYISIEIVKTVGPLPLCHDIDHTFDCFRSQIQAFFIFQDVGQSRPSQRCVTK